MRTLVVTVLAAAVLVTACGDGGGGTESPTVPGTIEPTTLAPSVPTTPTPPPSPTPSPTPAETTGSPSSLPSPLTVSLQHGGTYFGVYLAAAAQGAPELDAAVAQLAALGIDAYPGDIACDQGAAAQLGVGDDLMAVAVYFGTRSDAETFAGALDPPPLGIAKVKTYCLD